MILVYVLIAWACLAAVSVASDRVFMFRSLSGRDGADALALTQEHAARAGGTSRWITISLLHDILMPWLIWYGLLTAHRDDRS
jgi:hypothetical protein